MATATEPPPALLEDPVVELTADQFLGMAEAGLFAPESRAYLWDGRIVEEMAKTLPHAMVSQLVQEAILPHLPAGWMVYNENPIRLDARRVPLPDFAVLRGSARGYLREGRYPSAGDVGLVVEVSVSSLARDLGPRAEGFAWALVPAYWVVDPVGLRVVEHTGPRVVDGVGSYENVRTLGRDGELRLILDGREAGVIPVRDLLP